MTVEQTTYEGWKAVQLADNTFVLVVIPALGGKIVSLRRTDSPTEWLWQDPTRPFHTPVFGDDFGNYDASGWDECFPTIGECLYPDAPWMGVPLADHGELWCAPWRYEIVDDTTLYMHTYGVRFGYHFERWIRLGGARAAQFRYRVENLTPFPFKMLWSTHPLLAAEPGMQVIIPGEQPMRVAHAVGGRIVGDLQSDLRWPMVSGADGQSFDYGLIERPDLGTNDKVFVDAPTEGWCALVRPRTGETLRLTFDPADVGVIGVCINHGGYPFTGEPAYWVAVEPCWGWPDRLDEAVEMGVHATLDGWQSRTWTLGVALERTSVQ